MLLPILYLICRPFTTSCKWSTLYLIAARCLPSPQVGQGASPCVDMGHSATERTQITLNSLHIQVQYVCIQSHCWNVGTDKRSKSDSDEDAPVEDAPVAKKPRLLAGGSDATSGGELTVRTKPLPPVPSTITRDNVCASAPLFQFTRVRGLKGKCNEPEMALGIKGHCNVTTPTSAMPTCAFFLHYRYSINGKLDLVCSSASFYAHACACACYILHACHMCYTMHATCHMCSTYPSSSTTCLT